MCGRVTLFLLFLLFSAATATPQCNYRLEYSANVRSSYFDAVLDGNDLWTATGYGVRLYDRTFDPPRLIAALAVPGTTRAIDVRDGVAYAGSGTAIHIVRRAGEGLEHVRALDIGATVNDLITTPSSLFVATGSGLLYFDRRDPLNPPSPTPLATSSANVLSLARNGDEVLAADADASVERFNGTTGSPLGTLPGLTRSLSVNVAGSRIFVSDGQQTAIHALTGPALATAPVGGTTVAAYGDNIFFMAGTDRRFRVVDLAVAGRHAELFAGDIVPTGGSVNRIGALVAAGNRLYVAAGDAGLITLDTTRFTSPFPLRAHPFSSKTSIVDAGAAVFSANSSGGLTELTRFSSGNLDEGRSWAADQVHIVHDFANDFLLTSSGSALHYWSTRATTPALISSTPFQGPIRTAVLSGTTALALLEDGSLWRADITAEAPVPTRIETTAAAFLARSERGVALAAVNPAGTTDIRFYPGGDFASLPMTAAIPGASPVLAMSESRVAVFTFRGITVVDFSGAAPVETILPQSNTALVIDMAMRGSKLIDVTQSELRIWDLDQRRLVRSFAIASQPAAVSMHPSATTASVLTSDSVVNVDYQASSRQPEQTSVLGGNRYPRKVIATASRLFLFDRESIDVLAIGHSPAPTHLASIRVAGALDIAATETAIFVLFGSRVVASYTHTGTPLRSITIDEGSDTVPESIVVAGGAPWVSVSRGCLSSGCEARTIVLDPASLVRTATLEGGIRDITVSGSVAYALVDIPPAVEIRSYSIADPLHPTVIASRASEGSPAAIDTSGTALHTLGTRLFSYSTPDLSKIAEELPEMPVIAASDLSIDESCAVVTGRSSGAELLVRSGAQWTRSAFLSLPGIARGIARQEGRFIVLTDYSIEIWSRLPAPIPPRRRLASLSSAHE